MASGHCEPSPGCICYQDKVLFDTFLQRNKPSEITDPKLFWVYVECPRRRIEKQHVDIIHVQLLWKRVTESGEKVNPDDIKAIASATGYTSGKWIIQCKQGIDELWKRIALGVTRGELGVAAKVTTKSSAREKPGKEHVICVFTVDFTNVSDVMQIGKGIQNLGVRGKIVYKPDIYTNCGIYFKNPWGIDPSLYNLS